MKLLYTLIILFAFFISCSTEPEDCAGVAGGNSYMDDCGGCDANVTNDNTTCEQDCAGVWGGLSYLDECGGCDSDSSNDCVHDLELALITSGDLYADSCPYCINDPERINFSINLTHGDEPAAGKAITIYTIPVNEESPNNIEFQIAPLTTSTSGFANFVYDDNGYDGNYHIIASFTDSETDSTIKDTSTITVLPYYLKVEYIFLEHDSEITVEAGTDGVPIAAKVYDADGFPLENISVSFESDATNTIDAFFMPQIILTDALGNATVTLGITDTEIDEDGTFKINAFINHDDALDDKYKTSSILEINEQQYSSPNDNGGFFIYNGLRAFTEDGITCE